MNPLLKLLACAGLMLALAWPAQAQDMPVMFDGLAGQMAMTNLLFENTTGRMVRDKASSPGTATETATKSLAYVPSAALKQQTVQGYVDRLKTKNPAASQAVATNFGPGKNDYDRTYQGITQGTGLRPNNAADALAAYLVLGWMIVNNVQQASGLPAGAPRGVSTQLEPRLAANAQLAAPDAAAKLGEEMKLLFVVVQGGWQSALKEGRLPAYQQGIAAMFKNQYGLDMATLALKGNGFGPK